MRTLQNPIPKGRHSWRPGRLFHPVDDTIHGDLAEYSTQLMTPFMPTSQQA